MAKRVRRVFTAADKLRIVQEADSCLASGKRGALGANSLAPGDVGRFTVHNPDSAEMLYQREGAMDYAGGVDAGVACWSWELKFDDRTGSVPIGP